MTEKIKYRQSGPEQNLNTFSTVQSRIKKSWSNYHGREVDCPYGLAISQQLPTCCAYMYISGFDAVDANDMEIILCQAALWGRKALCWVTEHQTFAWKYLAECPYAKCLSEVETRMVKTNPYKVRTYEIFVPRDAVEGLPEKRKDA